MTKIVLRKITSAIFLAIVLLAGTIAAFSPSFMTNASAQSEPYYDGMDDRYSNYKSEPEYTDSNNYNIYEPKPEYPLQYAEKEYNSYTPVYGMDNSYESQYPSEYKDKDNYRPDYPQKYTDDRKYNSYKPDNYVMDNDYKKKSYGYESNYKQYEKDDRDKSKDSSSVNINKLNCINNNININGNNTGDINVGNKGAVEGYLGGYSSGSKYFGEGYYDGYNKQGKGFDCIINNNNNNTNVVSGGGNVIDGNVIGQCAIDVEACFAQFLNPTEFQQLTNALNDGITVQIGENTVTLNSFAEMCDALEGLTFEFDSLLDAISDIAFQAGILSLGGGIFECIAEALGIPITPTLAASNTNTDTSSSNINTAGGLVASSFSSSPSTIAQGTEEDLSALEKTTKLKQQWLNLLP